jgi:hypothetical protein
VRHSSVCRAFSAHPILQIYPGLTAPGLLIVGPLDLLSIFFLSFKTAAGEPPRMK